MYLQWIEQNHCFLNSKVVTTYRGWIEQLSSCCIVAVIFFLFISHFYTSPYSRLVLRKRVVIVKRTKKEEVDHQSKKELQAFEAYAFHFLIHAD